MVSHSYGAGREIGTIKRKMDLTIQAGLDVSDQELRETMMIVAMVDATRM